jgi:hypothetical protein
MFTAGGAFISANQVVMQGIRHTHPHPLESERLRDIVTDILTVVLTGNGLDQDRLDPMGGSAVIHDLRPWLPFQSEITDFLA